MKKTLAILLALVLCLSAFVMIACNKCEHNFVDGVCTKCGDKDPNYKPDGPGGDDNNDVPVVDGKITLYFTLADESVAIPSYASPFFTGGQTGFATEMGAIEFKRLGETKVYYVQIEYDATKAQADEYAIVLGYNASSGLPADKIGLKWVDSYKSDECAAYPYPDNAKFVVADGANRINLGKHTFSTEVAQPIRINTTLAVTFLPALPETAEVYIIGTINDWNTSDLTKSKATSDANHETYTLALTDVLCSNHEYKILVFLDGTENVVKKNAAGEDLTIWDWQRPAAVAQADDEEAPAEKTYLAYIEISAGEANLPVSLVQSNRNSVVNLAGTVYEDEFDKDGTTVVLARKGLDILTAANLTEVEGKQDKLDADGKPVVDENGNNVKEGNGIWATKYIVASNKTLTVEFKEALPETAEVYVIGSFLASDWSTTVEKAHMNIAADRKSASVTYSMLPGDYEFNVVVVHKDIELNDTVQNIWDYGTALSRGEAGNNVNVKITISGFTDATVKLFAAAQDVPTIQPPVKVENVVLKVKFDKALPEGKHVFAAGNFEGWKGTEMTVDAEDATVYTLTMPEMLVKSYEFLVTLSDSAAMDWGTKYGAGGVLGGANATFTVAKDSTVIDLYGETVLAAPAADKFVETVTLQVTFATSQTGKNVWLAGDLTSWGGTADNKMTANADETVYTLVLTNVKVGTFGFKLCVTSGEEFSWDYCLGSNAPAFGGENASVTIAEDSTTVILFADVNEGVIVLA